YGRLVSHARRDRPRLPEPGPVSFPVQNVPRHGTVIRLRPKRHAAEINTPGKRGPDGRAGGMMIAMARARPAIDLGAGWVIAIVEGLCAAALAFVAGLLVWTLAAPGSAARVDGRAP